MKNKADITTSNLFKEIGTESPSQDFKNKVMDKIYSLEKSKSKYEPLLSKKAWIWIITITSSLITLLFLTGPDTKDLKFPFSFSINLSFNFPKISLSFPDYNIPEFWMYLVLILPIFFISERIIQKFLKKA